MNKTHLAGLLAAVVGLFLTLSLFTEPSLSQSSPASVALSGTVSSKEDGPMEGVLVSAKRSGSSITITVVSDEHGRYSFPRSRLIPGQYSLRIRAIGYDMDDAGPVEVTTNKAASADLKLHKIEDYSAQLTSAEWVLSFPGTEQQKKFFINCVNCHTLERIARAHHTADEWMALYQRMGSYSQGSSPDHPMVRLIRRGGGPGDGEGVNMDEARRAQAEYMSTLTWTPGAYPLKTLPRPSGAATRVVITEYDLPRRNAKPHDVILDSHGMVWYTDFGWQYLGMLDPKTGEVVEYNVPVLKPKEPTGLLDIEEDKAGYLWIGETLQGGLARFDPKTHRFTRTLPCHGLP